MNLPGLEGWQHSFLVLFQYSWLSHFHAMGLGDKEADRRLGAREKHKHQRVLAAFAKSIY